MKEDGSGVDRQHCVPSSPQSRPIFCEEYENGDEPNCIGLGIVQCLKCAASGRVPSSAVPAPGLLDSDSTVVDEQTTGGI